MTIHAANLAKQGDPRKAPIVLLTDLAYKAGQSHP